MRVVATLACGAAAWLAWYYGGELGDIAGFEELDPLPRLVVTFAVLGVAERIIARVSRN